MRTHVSTTFEFHPNNNDPDLVSVPLHLPEGIVARMDAAVRRPDLGIHSRADFAELAILFALRSLSADEAAIWVGSDDGAVAKATDTPDSPHKLS